jgi:hypothetical protein
MGRATRTLLQSVALLTALIATSVTLPVVVAATSASSATTWTLAQVAPPPGGWSAVAYLHGQWIALSRSGAIARSSNTSTWSVQMGPVGSWQTASYGANRFVALSSANVVPSEMISSNGVTWSTVTGPPGTPQQAGHPVLNGEWTGVTYGDGLFAAVSSVGTVVTSPNGVNWTRIFWRPQDAFSSITFGDGRFIAVDAAKSNVLLSLDGQHWSLIRQPLTGGVSAPPGGLHLGAVTYGNGNFVAFGTQTGAGYIATSVAGYVWTLHQIAPAQSIESATFGCGMIVAAGASTGSTNSIISSSIGQQWTASNVATTTQSEWTAVSYGARSYVAVDAAGDIASTRTGANCAAAVPLPPQQVSGNVHNGEVWTYMHPPISPGGARVVGYRVTISNGVVTKHCGAPVYFEPNCIIKGLKNHQVYWVTTQAINRFGYSAPTDPQFAIPVSVWTLDATAPRVASGASSVVQVTGVIANSEGIYPTTTVTVHFGPKLFSCRPNPFGECVLTVSNPPSGTNPLFATYSGYGSSYRSPTNHVDVAAS